VSSLNKSSAQYTLNITAREHGSPLAFDTLRTLQSTEEHLVNDVVKFLTKVRNPLRESSEDPVMAVSLVQSYCLHCVIRVEHLNREALVRVITTYGRLTSLKTPVSDNCFSEALLSSLIWC